MREWYIPVMSSGHASSPHTVVFFDGTCGLCNGFVDFLVRHDRGRRLRFAPLQGETAAHFARLPRALDSVVVADGPVVLVKSDAALCVFARLGWPWRLAGLARVVPRALRDAVYDLIARNRYRWFGQRDACRIPSEREARWFLP
jgi:predicted DCC family thiol-disulfide oxidoreductase YuxK